MSINPTSDIVLEVAQAADPSKARAASERLARLASGTTAGDFAIALATTTPNRVDPPNSMVKLGAEPTGLRAPAHARTKGYSELEGLVLQKLVETMLPKESGSFFGGGTAGDVWRSMLAEELAKGLGKSVDLGIGDGHSPSLGPRRAAVASLPALRDFQPEQKV